MSPYPTTPDIVPTSARHPPPRHPPTFTRHRPDIRQTSVRHPPDIVPTSTRHLPDIRRPDILRHPPDIRRPDIHPTSSDIHPTSAARHPPDIYPTSGRHPPPRHPPTSTRHSPGIHPTSGRHLADIPRHLQPCAVCHAESVVTSAGFLSSCGGTAAHAPALLRLLLCFCLSASSHQAISGSNFTILVTR